MIQIKKRFTNEVILEISDWWGFDDQRIIKMDGKTALKWWREWKDTLKMLIEKSPAVATGKEESNA